MAALIKSSVESPVPQQLKTILRLCGLSQEKLAHQLGVSFATLNSWINGRSTPRKNALAKIHRLYLDITGQKMIPPDQLAAKKNEIQSRKEALLRSFKHNLKHNRKHNLGRFILDNPDIYDQLVLALTYNSNSIEGSTLTEPETAAILFQDSVLPDKSMVEHMEVKNHQAALQVMLNHMASGPGTINEELVLLLHRVLMNGILPDAGGYRQHGVRIVGADVPTANYLKVPILMADLFNNTANNIGPMDNVDIITRMAEVHSRFEQIHPFSDGNGRVGRLLMGAMALSENLPPAVIPQAKKRFYYSYLNRAQQSSHADLSLLEDFVCDALVLSFEILERK